MLDSSLGVVVLTHGSSRESLELARQLIGEGVAPSSITIVQNPTSPDDLTLEPPDPAVAVIRMDRNVGYAGGMNAGVRKQLGRRADPILVLTHEIRFRPGALAKLVDGLADAPRFGVVGPALWLRDRNIPFSYGGRRGRRGGVEQIKAAPAAGAAGIAPCDWIDGTAMLIRAEVLRQIGLFDERFFIYFEDGEFAVRTGKAGWQVGVVVDAVAETAPGKDTRPGAWTYLCTRNGLETARLAGGAGEVFWELARQIRNTWQLLRAYRGSGRNDQNERNWVEVRAIWRGILDFLRRRFGPPPRGLGGLGDVGGA